MPDYRRRILPGGTFFFTVNLFDRGSDLLVHEVTVLREAVARVRQERPFRIDAFVVLPDHLHAVWTLPEGDIDYSRRWQAIKARFTLGIPARKGGTASRIKRGERAVWQRRFWEHTIRDDRDYAAHVDYVHFNPVKHGLADSAGAWPYSSFRHAVGQGFYPASWAGPQDEPPETGE